MTTSDNPVDGLREVGISIDTASRITYRSGLRTWLRRIDDGSVRKVGPHGGARTHLHIDDVMKWVPTVVPISEREVFVLASSGNLAAAADVGALFYAAGRYDLAADWLKDAADRGSADAMQWLATAHAAGNGVEKSDELALSWLAKAAAAKHPIAAQQLRELR